MGCGKSKSKQDVATGNTVVTARKNSFNNNNAEEPKKISKDIETIQEKPTTTNEEIVEYVNQIDDHETENVQVAAAPEVKEISENTGLILDNHREEETVESTVVIDRDEKINEGNGVAAAVVEGETTIESAGERLISRGSPNHYFSSRKDEEAVGSVVSEISSVYDSPSHDNVKDEGLLLKESDKAGEVAVDDIESETNGEPATINKDSLIKEVEAVTMVAAPETSNPAVPEKDGKVGDDDEHLTESSQPTI